MSQDSNQLWPLTGLKVVFYIPYLVKYDRAYLFSSTNKTVKTDYKHIEFYS